MATKIISIETDAYDLLVMQEFKGKGAGPRRKRRRPS
jgi:hypothetical protein